VLRTLTIEPNGPQGTLSYAFIAKEAVHDRENTRCWEPVV